MLRIVIARVESLVMLHVHEDSVFIRLFDELDMVLNRLGRGFGDEHMNLPLDCIQCDIEMRRVRGEDGDCVAWAESIDGSFVGVGIDAGVGGVGGEGYVEVVVGFGNVLLEVGADCGVFCAVDAGHGEGADFTAAAEVEKGEADYANLKFDVRECGEGGEGGGDLPSCRRWRRNHRPSRWCTRRCRP